MRFDSAPGGDSQPEAKKKKGSLMRRVGRGAATVAAAAGVAAVYPGSAMYLVHKQNKALEAERNNPAIVELRKNIELAQERIKTFSELINLENPRETSYSTEQLQTAISECRELFSKLLIGIGSAEEIGVDKLSLGVKKPKSLSMGGAAHELRGDLAKIIVNAQAALEAGK